MSKWVRSDQMWYSMFIAAFYAIFIGTETLNFGYVMLTFWIAFPILMVLSFIYNWIIK